MTRRGWKDFTANFDKMVPALTLTFYSVVYSVAALVRVEEIKEAVSPYTHLAYIFSVIIILNAIMMGMGGYLGKKRLISWGALVFFCIWISTAIVYIQTGAWYYLFTITTTPIFLSVYISMRTNTWLFHTDSS